MALLVQFLYHKIPLVLDYLLPNKSLKELDDGSQYVALYFGKHYQANKDIGYNMYVDG